MENELKIILFEILYNKLNLKDIEQYFTDNAVRNKEFVYDTNLTINPKYFWLLNDVHTEYLDDSERNQLNQLYNEFKLGNISAKIELYSFLEKNLLKLLIPQTEERFFYWGPKNFKYIAPTKAIALAFHYIEFTDNEIEDERKKEIIADRINELQKSNFEGIDVPVAVIIYNEVFDYSKRAIKL